MKKANGFLERSCFREVEEVLEGVGYELPICKITTNFVSIVRQKLNFVSIVMQKLQTIIDNVSFFHWRFDNYFCNFCTKKKFKYQYI